MLPVPPVRNTVFFVMMYRLSEPAFRVLRLAVFPKFKVDLVVAGLCLHGSEDLSCGHFVTGLDAHRSKLAINVK